MTGLLHKIIEKIEPSIGGYYQNMKYYPASSILRDGEIIDCVYFVNTQKYFEVWGNDSKTARLKQKPFVLIAGGLKKLTPLKQKYKKRKMEIDPREKYYSKIPEPSYIAKLNIYRTNTGNKDKNKLMQEIYSNIYSFNRLFYKAKD